MVYFNYLYNAYNKLIYRKMKMYITQNLLDKIATFNACSELVSNTATQLFSYKQTVYIITSTTSQGSKGFLSATAHRCVLASSYKGNAVLYAVYGFEVMDNKKERGSYEGVLFKNKKTNWVITSEKVTFLPIQKENQLNLF